MKKIKIDRVLSRSEQMAIFGGTQQAVNCRVSGGCTCPDNPSITYDAQAECLSCYDTNNGFECVRGDYRFEVTCASEASKFCGTILV